MNNNLYDLSARQDVLFGHVFQYRAENVTAATALVSFHLYRLLVDCCWNEFQEKVDCVSLYPVGPKPSLEFDR